MEYDHLIFPSISNHNKERPLPLSYTILYENPDSVIYFLPMHGEILSLRPELGEFQIAEKRKHVGRRATAGGPRRSRLPLAGA